MCILHKDKSYEQRALLVIWRCIRFSQWTWYSVMNRLIANLECNFHPGEKWQKYMILDWYEKWCFPSHEIALLSVIPTHRGKYDLSQVTTGSWAHWCWSRAKMENAFSVGALQLNRAPSARHLPYFPCRHQKLIDAGYIDWSTVNQWSPLTASWHIGDCFFYFFHS